MFHVHCQKFINKILLKSNFSKRTQ